MRKERSAKPKLNLRFKRLPTGSDPPLSYRGQIKRGDLKEGQTGATPGACLEAASSLVIAGSKATPLGWKLLALDPSESSYPKAQNQTS